MVELKDLELQALLSIDKYSLDEEWEDQSIRYMYYAEKNVEKTDEYVKLKNLLSVKTAEIELGYRTGAIPTDVKITEGAISALVKSHPELNKLQEQVNQLKKESDMLSSIVTAFEHRKRALEQEGSLLIGGFYSMPNIKEDVKSSQQELARKRAKGA